MIISQPPSANKDRPVKQDSKYLSTCLNSVLRELVTTEDGRKLTKAQAISDRLVSIAIFSESNADSVSAAKLIFDRVLGKAAVQKDTDVKEMPKVILAMREDDLQQIEEKAGVQITEEEEEPVVAVKTDTGDEYLL